MSSHASSEKGLREEKSCPSSATSKWFSPTAVACDEDEEGEGQADSDAELLPCEWQWKCLAAHGECVTVAIVSLLQYAVLLNTLSHWSKSECGWVSVSIAVLQWLWELYAPDARLWQGELDNILIIILFLREVCLAMEISRRQSNAVATIVTLVIATLECSCLYALSEDQSPVEASNTTTLPQNTFVNTRNDEATERVPESLHSPETVVCPLPEECGLPSPTDSDTTLSDVTFDCNLSPALSTSRSLLRVRNSSGGRCVPVSLRYRLEDLSTTEDDRERCSPLSDSHVAIDSSPCKIVSSSMVEIEDDQALPSESAVELDFDWCDVFAAPEELREHDESWSLVDAMRKKPQAIDSQSLSSANSRYSLSRKLFLCMGKEENEAESRSGDETKGTGIDGSKSTTFLRERVDASGWQWLTHRLQSQVCDLLYESDSELSTSSCPDDDHDSLPITTSHSRTSSFSRSSLCSFSPSQSLNGCCGAVDSSFESRKPCTVDESFDAEMKRSPVVAVSTASLPLMDKPAREHSLAVPVQSSLAIVEYSLDREVFVPLGSCERFEESFLRQCCPSPVPWESNTSLEEIPNGSALGLKDDDLDSLSAKKSVRATDSSVAASDSPLLCVGVDGIIADIEQLLEHLQMPMGVNANQCCSLGEPTGPQLVNGRAIPFRTPIDFRTWKPQRHQQRQQQKQNPRLLQQAMPSPTPSPSPSPSSSYTEENKQISIPALTVTANSLSQNKDDIPFRKPIDFVEWRMRQQLSHRNATTALAFSQTATADGTPIVRPPSARVGLRMCYQSLPSSQVRVSTFEDATKGDDEDSYNGIASERDSESDSESDREETEASLLHLFNGLNAVVQRLHGSRIDEDNDLLSMNESMTSESLFVPADCSHVDRSVAAPVVNDRSLALCAEAAMLSTGTSSTCTEQIVEDDSWYRKLSADMHDMTSFIESLSTQQLPDIDSQINNEHSGSHDRYQSHGTQTCSNSLERSTDSVDRCAIGNSLSLIVRNDSQSSQTVTGRLSPTPVMTESSAFVRHDIDECSASLPLSDSLNDSSSNLLNLDRSLLPLAGESSVGDGNPPQTSPPLAPAVVLIVNLTSFIDSLSIDVLSDWRQEQSASHLWMSAVTSAAVAVHCQMQSLIDKAQQQQHQQAVSIAVLLFDVRLIKHVVWISQPKETDFVESMVDGEALSWLPDSPSVNESSPLNKRRLNIHRLSLSTLTSVLLSISRQVMGLSDMLTHCRRLAMHAKQRDDLSDVRLLCQSIVSDEPFPSTTAIVVITHSHVHSPLLWLTSAGPLHVTDQSTTGSIVPFPAPHRLLSQRGRPLVTNALHDWNAFRREHPLVSIHVIDVSPSARRFNSALPLSLPNSQ